MREEESVPIIGQERERENGFRNQEEDLRDGDGDSSELRYARDDGVQSQKTSRR